MSRAAKSTLTGAVMFSAFVVWGVHYLQISESETMYKGVLRDEERRKEKHKQRELELQESLKKRAIYEAVQTVATSSSPPSSATAATSTSPSHSVPT